MRPHPVRRRPFALRPAAAMLLALAGGCSDGPLAGPGLPGRGVALRLEPRVEPRASVVAASVTKVRVAITRVPDGLTVLDSVVDLVGGTRAELDLAVPLASTNDRFAVRLAAADAAGDTIFRATDTTQVVRGSAAPSLELLLRYAGPDTGLARIVAGPDTVVVDAGAAAPLWAVGYRPGASDPSPLTHVAWRSSDPTVVDVSRTGGRVRAIAPGHAAWVHATTVTGLADSVRVVVRHVVGALEASPASLGLITGASARVAVAGRASDGTALVPEAVTWTSSDPTVAVVEPNGMVTAMGAGSATITAASGAATVAVPVAVQPPAVTDVRVAPTTVSLLRTMRAQLVATVTLETGAVVADRPITWTTSDPTIATVGADGVVSALGVGTATITARAGGQSASTTVTVDPLPADSIIASPATVQVIARESLTLAATVTDATGLPLPNVSIVWSSADPGVAIVSSAGVLTGVVPGTTTVTARSEGRTSTVAVTVLPIPVAEVRLSSGKLPLIVGDSFDFDATPVAADGTPLLDRAVTWSSKTVGVATVDQQGRVRTLGTGFTIVTATSEGVEGSVKIDVVPIPVSRVQIAASAISLLAGGTFQLRAEAYDSLGRLLTGRSVSWWPGDASIAHVDGDGLVFAKKAGTTTVTASIGGKTATTTVSIAPPPVPTVQFTPAAGAQYAFGQTMAAQTVAISQDVGTTTLQLASHNGGIAGVQQAVTVAGTTSATFTVTGVALGPVRLQGTSAVAATGVTDVTVVAGTLRADGWAGATIPSGGYRRIRIHAGGVDGAATDATFAAATPLTVDFDDRHLEVHLDVAPSKPVGPADHADRGNAVSRGQAITPTVGGGYVSLLVRGKNPGTATLSLTGPVTTYVPLLLTGLTIQ